MKQKGILLFSILFTCFISSQNFTESDILGDWAVKNVQVTTSGLSEAQLEYIDTIKNAYANAVFQFKEDAVFNMEIDFEEITERLQNSCWKFRNENSQIVVLDCNEIASKELSWEFPFKISKVDDKVLFTIEPIFTLEMKKAD